MIKIEDLKELKIEEMQQLLTNDISEYAAKVKTLSLDELKEEEKQLMEAFKINDDYIKGVLYYLPEEIEVTISKNSQPIKKKAKDIHSDIVYFLDTIESNWQTSLGILQLIAYWKYENTLEVPYGTLDSTLRTLGSVVKYKGEQDLVRIFAINNYLSTVHNEFVTDNMFIQYLSSLHQTILDQMQELNKEATENQAKVVSMNKN